MIRFLLTLLVAVTLFVRPAAAQSPNAEVWVQIEAHPSLTVAEDELSAASDRLHALRRLLRLAREAGAIGTDRPAAIVTGDR